MVPIPLSDVLEFIPAETDELTVIGQNFEGNKEENIVWKALQLLRTKAEFPSVHIVLQKNVPTGAGLGGGSSDAARFLVEINTYFQLGFSLPELEKLAAELGSDCAFFVKQKPQLCEGRGEVLTEIEMTSLKDWQLVLLFPGFPVPTASAYAGVQLCGSRAFPLELLQKTPHHWKDGLENAFENSVFEEFPKLKSLKNWLYQKEASYAALSGSGSTVFGLFERPLQTDEWPCEHWRGTLE